MAWPTTDSAAAAPLGHQACFVPRTRWKLIYSHFSRIMSTHQSASSGIAASFKLMHKTHAYDWLLFVVRSSQVQWWWCSERSKVYFRLLGKMIEPFFSKSKKSVVQVNLCQKHLFLHQLTHNLMTDCSLNYEFSAWKLQAQNMLRTCCVPGM